MTSRAWSPRETAVLARWHQTGFGPSTSVDANPFFRHEMKAAYRADFPSSLSGSTPSPIPTGNTADVASFTVGSWVYAPPLAAALPWLDANLSVRNINLEQSALIVPNAVRAMLTSLGASVSDCRWVAGGYLYTRWQPSASQPAIPYATAVRNALLQAAQQINPTSQIIMGRFRVTMPIGRTDLYVYPTGTVPPPPAPPAGVAVQSSQGAPPTEANSASSSNTSQTVLILAGSIAAALVIGGAGFYFYRRQHTVTSNRSRARKSARRNRRRS